jgi:hypothetical protein
MFKVIYKGKVIGEIENKFNAGDVFKFNFVNYEIQSIFDDSYVVDKF